MSNKEIGVRQFRVPSLARSETQLSYCVWDRQSHQAAFIDSHFSAAQEYTDFVVSERLKPIVSIETQLHYSHPTAAHVLSRQFGIAPHASGGFSLGSFKLEIMKTPGVRPDAMVIRVLGGETGIVFTGETLWAGASAGFGMPGSDVNELWRSIQTLKKTLNPDDTVFTGYDVQEICFSTWRRELEKNPDLLAGSPEELARLKAKFPFHPADDFLLYAKYNSSSGNESTGFHKAESPFRLEGLDLDRPSFASITAEKLACKKGAMLIDIREPEEFKRGHIPDSRNVSLDELAFALKELSSSPRVYLLCQSGRRSSLAAGTLSYLGLKDVVLLTGGFQAWLNAGLPVEK